MTEPQADMRTLHRSSRQHSNVLDFGFMLNSPLLLLALSELAGEDVMILLLLRSYRLKSSTTAAHLLHILSKSIIM